MNNPERQLIKEMLISANSAPNPHIRVISEGSCDWRLE